ncbi:MAG TPA: AraC family transcriptional regulator [Thermoanaerobaculia bacterium]|nr:AraC family transcriptional regulator [Thermoanaerobaculia bacterium]
MPPTAPAPPMSYAEVPPPPDLAPWIAALWTFRIVPEAGEIEHRIPLTGGVMLSAGADGEPALVGPRTAPLTTTVRGGDVFRGVHLRPGAAGALLHVSAGALRDAIGPARLWLDPVWCDLWRAQAAIADDAAALSGLAGAFRELASRAAPLDDAVAMVVDRLIRSHGTARLDELAAEAALSPRQLRRRFRAAVGLSPKELARIRRLRAAAASAAVEDRPWADLVADGGYADQPHLVREFRRLLGVTPGGFGQHARRIDHRLVD